MTDQNSGSFNSTSPNSGAKQEVTYCQSMDDTARRLAFLNLTEEEIARFFQISVDTLLAWKTAHPSFGQALNTCELTSDGKVVHSLYQRAVGMVVVDEKTIRNAAGETVVVKLRREIPPDIRAALLWLRTRQPDLWGVQPDNRAQPGPKQRSPADLSDEELKKLCDDIRRGYKQNGH